MLDIFFISQRFEEGKATVFLNEGGFLVKKSIRESGLKQGKTKTWHKSSRVISSRHQRVEGSDLPSPTSVTSTGTVRRTLQWGLPGRMMEVESSTYFWLWRKVNLQEGKTCLWLQWKCLVPSQILKASQINSNLRGFGISFSGSLDVDNNGYPDFAVGAHKSNQAVLLRSQPIVNYQVERMKNEFFKSWY